jgi:hypothetical protein
MEERQLQESLNRSSRILIMAKSLSGATMLDGSRYAGRFQLSGDIARAKLHKINLQDPEAMAKFYGVSLEEYQRDQEWAQENLVKIRREVGLEQDDTAKIRGTQHLQEPYRTPQNDNVLPLLIVQIKKLLSLIVRRLIG